MDNHTLDMSQMNEEIIPTHVMEKKTRLFVVNMVRLILMFLRTVKVHLNLK
jgi:hypothetical protein